ncbi:MAG: SgcJ/EcaC family oxidoreductase [Pirellulales bacterium]|nr:SgcJ/EcaC family oxidoreductase [Pirellulales bacterium]
MKRFAYLTIISLIILAIAGPAAGDNKAPKNKKSGKKVEKKVNTRDSRAADVKAIIELGRQYREAFAKGDAKKVVELWARNGEYFGASGRHIKGRAAIEREYANHFAINPGQKLVPARKTIRFIRPDVALVTGVSNISPAPPGPPSKCTYSVILVKQKGRWLMDNVRETMTFTPSNYDKLAELSWLVGRWTYSGDSEQIKSADILTQWSRNKNYILRNYTIRLAHEEIHSGVQRIGWDPVAGTVCSWMFASDGSHTEGIWTKEDNRWIVQSKGVLRDGKKISATNIITPVDADTFTFQSINRVMDGTPESNVGPIEVKRRQPREKKPREKKPQK